MKTLLKNDWLPEVCPWGILCGIPGWLADKGLEATCPEVPGTSGAGLGGGWFCAAVGIGGAGLPGGDGVGFGTSIWAGSRGSNPFDSDIAANRSKIAEVVKRRTGETSKQSLMRSVKQARRGFAGIGLYFPFTIANLLPEKQVEY